MRPQGSPWPQGALRPEGTHAQGTRRGRPNDPGRRERIIDACLAVIGRDGVAGASQRKVAAEAGVPLGAMTYYFADRDELLREAFTRFALAVSESFDARLAAAADRDEARRAVVGIVLHRGLMGDAELVIAHELYTLAAREPRFRAITAQWMRRSRASLERHFEPVTARLLDALIEGLTIHRALDDEPRGDEEVASAVALIAGE